MAVKSVCQVKYQLRLILCCLGALAPVRGNTTPWSATRQWAQDVRLYPLALINCPPEITIHYLQLAS